MSYLELFKSFFWKGKCLPLGYNNIHEYNRDLHRTFVNNYLTSKR